MPVYTPMPEHHGERSLAESLAAMDDGKLHLWFDLALPGVANLDVVVWDETVGVFVLETKAVPVEAIRHFDDLSIHIDDRGWGQSPVAQARHACYTLKDYLRASAVRVPRIASTVVWPRISRKGWLDHWQDYTFPSGYELSMVFADDVEGGLNAFRERLRWIARHPLWGATPTTDFVHEKVAFQAFANALRPRASARQPATVAETADETEVIEVTISSSEPAAVAAGEGTDGLRRAEETAAGTAEEIPGTDLIRVQGPRAEGAYRQKLWLGTEHVVDAARGAIAAIEQAASLMEPGWSEPYIQRIQEILKRLEQPFRLGVIGEFRAGKSSLVNALVGRQVALVAEMECTFAPQRFYYAPQPEASIVRRDGTVERVTVEALTTMFREAYALRQLPDLERTEVGLPAPILENLDIWDSPGLGGSEENAETARRFAETVDAALWVFDAGYSGQRSLSPTIASLEQHGKTLIGVVNKCEYMTVEETERVIEVLRRSYPSLREAEFVAFSALWAQEPETDREDDLDWAVDTSGNLKRLLDVIREVILASPGRLTGRAAAGDLRATASAVRDDLKASALEVRRRQFLMQSEMEKAERLLQQEISRIARDLENGAMSALRDHLIEAGEEAIGGMKPELLRDRQRAEEHLRSVGGSTLAAFVQEYFTKQRPWIEVRLRNSLTACGLSLSNALTPLELYDPAAPSGVTIGSGSEGADRVAAVGEQLASDVDLAPFDWDRATNVGAGTLGALGGLAALIPGPQWMVVLPATLIAAFIAGSSRTAPSERDLRDVLRNRWHRQVNVYLEKPELRGQLREALQQWCAALHGAVREDARALIAQQLFGEAGEEAYRRRLDQVTAFTIQVEMLIEQLGNPLFALPPTDDMLSNKVTIAAGERERTQELLRRVLGLAGDVLAITDGAFSVLSLPLLLETPDNATIRLLAWEQPLSEASPTFRVELESLRSKRAGHVVAAAPVRVGPSEEPLPSGSWIFVPGRAFHFNLPLYEVWTATGPVTFEPYEDAGNLYHTHFGRWWNGEVPGYQALPVQRRSTAHGRA